MTASATQRTFQPDGRPVLIGSLPLTMHAEALEWIFKATPEIPLWPQLPANPHEGMMNQFVEGFPGIIEEAGSILYDTTGPGFEEAMLAFFEAFLAVTETPEQLLGSMFAIEPKRAAGLFALVAAAKSKLGMAAVKGQITGPFTLLTGITDANKKLGYYDPMVREIVVKGLAARAAWQAMFLSQLKLPVLVFIDEPALAGLGSSSFIGVSSDDIRQDLVEVITAIQGAGGLAGIHVCANTDWNLLLSLPLDVLSFDAYGYFDRLITCRSQVLNFIDRGGILAWGLVPTGDAELIGKESVASLAARWQENATQLAGNDRQVRDILARSLITPSCGTGSLTQALAQRVLTLTRDTATALRQQYGL